MINLSFNLRVVLFTNIVPFAEPLLLIMLKVAVASTFESFSSVNTFSVTVLAFILASLLNLSPDSIPTSTNLAALFSLTTNSLNSAFALVFNAITLDTSLSLNVNLSNLAKVLSSIVTSLPPSLLINLTSPKSTPKSCVDGLLASDIKLFASVTLLFLNVTLSNTNSPFNDAFVNKFTFTLFISIP